MSNIKNLQMWKDICNDARISVRKSMFGLRTTAVYNPSGSIIDAMVLELTSNDGEQLRRILCASSDECEKMIAGFHPKSVLNGNYMAEVCTSRDGAFLAIMLMQFSILNYEQVTEALIFEAEEAALLGKLFKA